MNNVCVPFKPYTIRSVGPDSSVDIATELRVGRSEDQIPVGGRDFPHLSISGLGSTQPPIQWVPVLSRG